MVATSHSAGKVIPMWFNIDPFKIAIVIMVVVILICAVGLMFFCFSAGYDSGYEDQSYNRPHRFRHFRNSPAHKR